MENAKIPTCAKHNAEGCLLFVHGASRGNPGHAAIGAVIKARANNKVSVVWRGGKSIGKKTDNEAEFESLLFGMGQVLKGEYKHVMALSDSELLVKQFHGQYEVRSPELRSLLHRVKETSRQFCLFSFIHIPRSENTEADAEANHALDNAIPSDRLKEDSSCPVCFELFTPPVFQCPKGHLICQDCLDNLLGNSDNESCPECRTPYQGQRIPNVVADDLIKNWRGQSTMERSLATYKLSPKYKFPLHEGPHVNSAKVGEVNGGIYVDIMEIQVRSEIGGSIRGRTPLCQWLTIEKTNPKAVFAHPLSLGTYKLMNHASLATGIRKISQSSGKSLEVGDYVDIVETRVVSEDNRVRAKITNGLWMSLINTSDGFEWASAVPLGAYKVTRFASLCSELDWTGKNAQIVGELQVGDYVDIIETKVVAESKRVRAKTSMGLWMSLVNTDDRSVWAKPRDVESQETQDEEEARHLQSRTCGDCGHVFLHSRARDQHHKDCHQFSCQGNIHWSNSFLNFNHLVFQCVKLTYYLLF